MQFFSKHLISIDMMKIKLENGSTVEVAENSTAKDIAVYLKLTAPDKALGAKINGQNKDLSTSLNDNDEVLIINFDSPCGKEIFWHTSAHILAQAVLRLWPEAKPTIGPPIEHGFYYDFANLQISDEDFGEIEKEMQAIVAANYNPQRENFTDKKMAIDAFHQNPYKCELIQEFPDTGEISAYTQGEFFDLCRGPHLPNLGKVKALKILKTSGAYWRGKSSNEMLTRIYGITFPDRKMLKAHLKQIEEAKKRDHKILGPKLGLFSLKEEAPGMPFIHPHGMIIWNKLLGHIRQIRSEADYCEIKTPAIMTRELWEISGHWENYRENMYTCSIEERDFAIKPMNCPGCVLFYRSNIHSYKEFPLRIGEIGHVHRYEPSGAISGLFRVRGFHQDDAHIFLTKSQIEDEILSILKMAKDLYSLFGLSFNMELSTRPEKNTIGSDEDWEITTTALKNALDTSGVDYRINEGDGAFYGPKIDLHIQDSIGRTWQCGTIQLDMALPQKFELEFVDNEGSRKRPVMIHVALFGSVERFFGILIEHFAGRFPLWLSPRQVRIVTVADRHEPYSAQLAGEIKKVGLLCDIDASQESVGKKIRSAQINQVNYIITVGDKEIESNSIAVRTRNTNKVFDNLTLQDFITLIKEEESSKQLTSAYSSKE